jgi:hypothetical protein
MDGGCELCHAVTFCPESLAAKKESSPHLCIPESEIEHIPLRYRSTT